ncbi:hypothetical protein E0Z10_g10577 [Xylaria hypoxylon]|uniref:Uncharacterized protein n=1 Tax=Xylaria hypoxylon TaxID=37992 RepID=A0A4Z0Y5P7_9PEZI|nr:hypothetical protein E0Z10_g10577 [Xylaria hypoxylon]
MAPFKPSIGVELDFLLCFRRSDLPMRTDLRPTPGSRVIFPPSVLGMMEARIRRTIDDALARPHSLGDRVIKSNWEAAAPDALHLRGYQHWTIKAAETYNFPDQMRDEAFVRTFRWYPFKIASPALWVTENSWAEIRTVVQAMTDDLIIIIPPGAAMNFHYGHGKEYIPFRKLRRIAALLVAVDPLMTQLHPEYRRRDNTALSNRLYSRIAHGRPAELTARILGADYVEAEPEVPVRRRRPIPIPRPFRRRTPNFIAPFRRGQLTGYPFSTEVFRGSGYAEDNTDDFGPVEIPPAVREILQCRNAPTVAELMRYSPQPDDRPAYSFQAYTFDRYQRAAQNKRTIEFRQMASTFEPREVVAHGEVIVRLCEFAAEAPLEELWKIVLDCAVGENHGTWFDIFDLLADLELISEARILQHSVARFRGETVPKELKSDTNFSDWHRVFDWVSLLIGANEEGVSWFDERPAFVLAQIYVAFFVLYILFLRGR